MATVRQRIVAEKILEDIGNNSYRTGGQILRESGYSEAIAKNPKMIIESKGVQAILNEVVDIKKLVECTNKIALDVKDKRAALSAQNILYRLTNVYPDRESKGSQINDELARFYEE